MLELRGKDILLQLILTALLSGTTSASDSGRLDVFIIGGTGDLAKRYLWKGFFRLFQNEVRRSSDPVSMRFNGAGLAQIPSGSDAQFPLKSVLHDAIPCNDAVCEEDRDAFIALTNYVQVRTEKQYHGLCEAINQMNLSRHQAVFYLSVPPSAYGNIVRLIASNCDVENTERTYKFIFEKPFGTDFESAISLSSQLETHLDESQIFRVDHYLGKQAVSNILDFRKKNSGIEHLLNRKHVKSIKILVGETLGTKGRTSYYDKSGVIRDMLQNHLTEVLSRITMDLEDPDAKLQLLRNIQPVKHSDVLLGQYQGYLEEVFNETNIINSETPTFAAALLRMKSARWKNVPVLLVSGKRLDERVGYGRIVFKKSSGTFKQIPHDCGQIRPQLIFYIGHGQLKTPAILVSRSLPVNTGDLPSGWKQTMSFDSLHLFGTQGRCFRIFVPPSDHDDAYTFLISKIYKGDRTTFVATDALLESWKVWNPILKRPSAFGGMVRYPPRSSTKNILKFKITENGLKYDEQLLLDGKKCYVMNIFLLQCDERPNEGTFLGHPASIGPIKFVAKQLANDMMSSAKNGQSQFHLALSGGSSPEDLYSYLSTHLSEDFPWQRTHIWQVDERCEPEQSNFGNIKQKLLDKVDLINFGRVHAMPVSLETGRCSEEAAAQYESELIEFTAVTETLAPKLDYVVLGIGTDGHTASLFPGDGMLGAERYVAVGNVVGSRIISPRRMTLTLKAINGAKKVAVIAKGRPKCRILQQLITVGPCGTANLTGNTELVEKYPICGVSPSNGELKWYIDEEAMSCAWT